MVVIFRNYTIFHKFDADIGWTFTHFSNGVSRVPDMGINLLIPSVFAGINIRAYDFSVADYIEWNIGYRIKWKKK